MCARATAVRRQRARDALVRVEGWGRFSNFGGDTVFEHGFGITVLGPGQPLSMYHWETDQEDFLVLSNEYVALLGALGVLAGLALRASAERMG